MTHFSIVPPVGTAPTRARAARRRLRAGSALVAVAFMPGVALAGPVGGKIVAGDGGIAQSGTVTTITQKSLRAVSEWSSFDTSAGEMVRVDQQLGKKSVHVARVTGDLPTSFSGALTAPGTVILINRSGIVFTDTSRVNVGGLVATTSDIDTGKFMAGSNTFDIPGKPGASVVNKGSITFGEAGLAALVGAHASNEGQIYGRLGAVAVAGRQTFAVDVSGGDGILALETSAGTAAAVSASNTGTIDAAGSYVVISAEETVAALESLAIGGGSITAGAVDGHVGQVAIEGRDAVVSGLISAAGGVVDVRGDTVTMTADAAIDVSGQGGGGTVALGGGLRGEGRRADSVVMQDGATIAADGLGNSSGGLVTLWSTDFTGFAGSISARGGDFGGDGGFVEVSAKGVVGMWGDVVTLAPFGATGTLLIDPTNITIGNVGGALGGDIGHADSPANTNVRASDINALADGTNLVLEALNEIRVETAVDAGANITLRAGNDILVDTSLETTGTLNIAADYDFSGDGGPAAGGAGDILVSNGSAVTGEAGLIMTVGAGDAGADPVVPPGALVVSGDSTFTSGAALVLPDTVVTGAANATFVTTAGGISQSGNFTATGTGSVTFTSFAGVDLTTGTNDILVLAGASGGNADFTLGTTTAFGFNAAGFDITLEMTGGGESVTTNGTTPVIADTLTLAVDGTVSLTAATNLVGAVDGVTSDGVTGAFTFVNDGDLDIGFADTEPTSIDITTTAGSGTGALTQSADISSALTLDLAGAATLTNATNSFTSLTADTGAASSFTTAATLDLGASAFTGATSITTTDAANAITQSGAVSITGGALTVVSAGATTLTEATNSFTGLVATTGAASSFVTASALDLGASAFTGATSITTTGGTNAITQSAAFSVTGGALTLASAGATTLTEATNSFGALLATTGAASSFVTTTSLELGASAFTGATAISATGVTSDVTQSAGITVTGGLLTVVAGRDAVLNGTDNAFSALAGSAGNTGTFVTTTGLSLTYTTMGALGVTTGGNLTSGGPVNAGGLALDVTGDAALGNPTNTVGTLTGTVSGTLSYVDDGALSLGITADAMTVTATSGAITDGAGPVITLGSTTDGAASFFAFAEGAAGDISDDVSSNITFGDAATSFAGDLSVSGATVDIAVTGALDVVDAYATTAATFESDDALTMTRVAVGTDSGGAGADVTIDTPGDLLGIGTSVTGADIIADAVTFGAAGSVIGTAVDLGAGAVAITRFNAGAVTLADAATTTVASGVASGGLDMGVSGGLTIAAMDLSGGGLVTLTQATGTLTVDGVIADSLSLSADDVRLGFVQTAGTLDVTATGSILTVADASIAVPGDAAVAAPVLAAAAGPDVTDGTAAYAAPTRLLDIGGAARFEAPGDMFLVGTSAGAGFENDFQDGVTFTDGTGAGGARVAVEDANDIVINGIGAAGFEISNAAVAAGVDAAEAGGVTQTGTIHINGELTLITGDDGIGGPLGDVTLTLNNVLNDVAVRAENATVHSTSDVALIGTLDGDAVLTGDAEARIDRLTAINATITAAEANAVNSRLTGTLDITSNGAASGMIISQTIVDGDVTMAGGSGVNQIINSQLGGVDATIGGGLAFFESSELGATVAVTAGSALLGNISAGDFSLASDGNITLGSVATTGDLALEAIGGSITAVDSALGATPPPGPVLGGGVVPIAFGIDTSVAIGNAADDRVTFTSAGISRPGFTPVAAGVGLEVGGDALLIAGAVAGQGELVPGAGTFDITIAPVVDGLTFDFQNAVTVRADGNVTLHDNAGGILFDVPTAGMLSPSGNAVFNDDGGTVTGDAALHITGNLALTTTGAGGDAIDSPDDTDGVAVGADAELDSIIVGGTSVFDLSGDLLLDGIDGNSTHSFGSTVTVTANDVILTVDGDLSFGDVTADSLTVRSTGNIDDGAGTTMTIAGAAAFIAVDDNNTTDLSDDTYGGVTLDNPFHDLGGDVSAAGSFVTIDAFGDLALVDVWGHTGLDVSATEALDMTRVAAGGGTIGSGDTTFTIDAPSSITAAAGGDITVTDVIASSLTLRDLTAGDPNGTVSVTRFAVGTVDFGTPAAGLTLADGVITGALTLSAPGDLTLINIDTGGGVDVIINAVGTATVSGLTADNLTITAADARLGFLDVASGLTVLTTGTIETLSDATLATLIPIDGTTAVAAPDLPLSVPSTDAGATGVIDDAVLTTTAMTRLVSVGGPTELHANTSVVLTGTAVGGGFENDHLQVRVQDVDGPGTPMTVVIEDANDIAIAELEGADVTIRAGTDAGATGDITQFADVRSSGTASFIIEDDGAGNRGSVLLTNGGNAFNNLALSAGAATIFDDSGFNITGAEIDGALTVNSLTGPLGLADVTAGSIAIDTFGNVVGTRVHSAGTVDIATDGNLNLGNVTAMGAADLSAGLNLSVDEFAMAALQIGAGDGASIENGSAGALSTADGVPVTGDIELRNLTASSIDVAANGGISTAAVRTLGDMTLFALSGDIDLGRTAVGDTLALETNSGAITTRDATDGAVFSDPGSAVTVTGAGALVIGTDASGVTGVSDDRVTTTLSGSNDTDIVSPAITAALEVTNDAYVRAIGGDISITTADDGALASFGGGVMLTSGGAITIEAAGDLTLAHTRATTLGGSAFFDTFAVFAGGTLQVRANADGVVGTGADITQTGLIQANGTSNFVSGVHSGDVVPGELGSITLTDPTNVFALAVSALANDVAIAATGGLMLDDVRSIAAGGGTGGVTAAASGLLDATDVTADGAVDFDAGGALTMTDVGAGAGLTGDAVGDVIGTDVSATGAIDIDSSAGAVDMLRLTGGDALDLTAATSLDATTVAADGATTLGSGTTMTLDDVDAGTGTLTASAGGDVLGVTLASGGAMGVTSSGGAVDVTGVAGGAGLNLSALTTLDATTVAADGATTLGSGTTMNLDDVDAGTGTLTASAGGDVLGVTLASGGAMGVTSSGGAVDVTGVTGGALTLAANTAVDVDTATSDGAVTVTATNGALVATDLTGDGTMGLTSGADMTLLRVDAGTGAMTATAGGDILATTLDADASMTLAAATGGATLSDARTDGALDVDARDAVSLTDIDAGGAVTADSTAGSITALRVTGGDLMTMVANVGLSATDMHSIADMTLTAQTGTLLITGAETGGAFDGDAGLSLTASDLGAADAIDLDAGAGMDLDRIAAGAALTAAAAGTLTADDLQSTGAMSVTTSGGTGTVARAVSGDAMTVTASGAMQAERLSSTGDMQLGAGNDLLIAAIESGGSLAAESGSGAIRTFAAAAGSTVVAPEPVETGGAVADFSDVALTANGPAVDVADAAAFRAGGDIVLARTGSNDNIFGAGIAADAGGGLLIHSDGDVTVGTGALPAFASGALIADGLTTGNHARIEQQGATLTTAAGAVHDIGGDYTIAAGLGGGTVDVTLDNLMNVGTSTDVGTLEVMAEGGTVTIDATAPNMGLIVLADDLDITSTGNVGFGSTIVRRLVVDAAGAGPTTIGDAAQTPTRVGFAFSGVRMSAELTSDGTGVAEYALTTDAAAAMASVPAVVVTERLRIAQSGAGAATINLNDFSNMFPADVSVNVGGGVSLFEERTVMPAAALSYAESLGLGETGLLQFSEFVSGGNINVYSVDQIQFMGDLGIAANAFADIWLTLDPTRDPASTDPLPSIIFRGDVGGVGGAAGALFEALGDVYMFGTVGAGGPGNSFQPLGSVTIIAADVVAGAAPALLGAETGRIDENDLNDFITDLGEIGVTAPLAPTFGDLGEPIYLIDDGGDTTDYFFANRLDLISDGGNLLFVINREDAGGAFETALSFYGVNIGSEVRYGSGTLGIDPARVEMYGSVAGDRSRSAGIRVNGPIGTSYFFNGCLVRQTSSCTNLGTAVSVPPLPPIDVPVFELGTLDLNELFGAIGNEDLWRLPPAYLEDEDDQEGTN